MLFEIVVNPLPGIGYAAIAYALEHDLAVNVGAYGKVCYEDRDFPETLSQACKLERFRALFERIDHADATLIIDNGSINNKTVSIIESCCRALGKILLFATPSSSNIYSGDNSVDWQSIYSLHVYNELTFPICDDTLSVSHILDRLRILTQQDSIDQS